MKNRFNVDAFNNNPHTPSMRLLRDSAVGGEAEVRDFCIPINNCFPPQEFFDLLRNGLEFSMKFYPSDNLKIARELTDFIDARPENIVMGNGSTELITWIIQLFVSNNFVTPVPTFGRWTDVPLDYKLDAHFYARKEEDDFKLTIEDFVAFINEKQIRSAVLCNPNNPTGDFLERREMIELLEALRHLDVVVIDESFIDFSSTSDDDSVGDLINLYPNLIVLKSLGKNFGLHGIRFGYALLNENRAETLRRFVPRWNINGFAELVIKSLPHYLEEYKDSRAQTIKQSKDLHNALSEIKELTVFESRSNFVYVKLPDSVRGVELRNYLLNKHHILIRSCENKIGASEQFIRFATRAPKEVKILVDALREAIAHFSPRRSLHGETQIALPANTDGLRAKQVASK